VTLPVKVDEDVSEGENDEVGETEPELEEDVVTLLVLEGLTVLVGVILELDEDVAVTEGVIEEEDETDRVSEGEIVTLTGEAVTLPLFDGLMLFVGETLLLTDDEEVTELVRVGELETDPVSEGEAETLPVFDGLALFVGMILLLRDDDEVTEPVGEGELETEPVTVAEDVPLRVIEELMLLAGVMLIVDVAEPVMLGEEVTDVLTEELAVSDEVALPLLDVVNPAVGEKLEVVDVLVEGEVAGEMELVGDELLEADGDAEDAAASTA
jgi:hypothetical protein